MSGSIPAITPHLDFSLRTRKSNQDIQKLYGSREDIDSNNDSYEQNLLLADSEVIEIGTLNDGKYLKPNRKQLPNWLQFLITYRSRIYTFLIGCLFLGMLLLVTDSNFFKRQSPSTYYFNGTTYFDKTVIYISLDGFRNDYLERKVTPNIEKIAEQGIRAEYMMPSFPSITFPNHWTLVTGLYPESHGIVANEFFDPVYNEEFIHKNATISGDPKWWGGEPIWRTVQRHKQKSAVIMWPGSNVEPTADYYIPYSREVSAISKMDMVFQWLDLPLNERPQLISIYIPQVDQKGHGGGPDGKQLNAVLSDMDNAIGYLMQGLQERNLDNHVHVVIVSDHGMAASHKTRLIFYDEILSAQTESYLSKREAWPLLGLRPKSDSPLDAVDQIYNDIQKYMARTPDPHFQVYKRNEIPERFHYHVTERIAPILLVPDVGYSIIRSTDFNVSLDKDYRPRGIHGYDNLAPEMRAIFVAKGPKISQKYNKGTILNAFYNVEIYQFLTTLLDMSPAVNNATLEGLLGAT
ncbi:alkaline-phosphatase-like protein [Cokeromyces recurvatus]|uniref:alkaline-phosphatase-like protein n=1 Tax=Cokeromyces recurvatus TaxID=90255 RepID=UPI002220354D|nr:alkaline-phosphatase-like protein [Cokeromyces recurvatus]KAI7898456.1 alkaline-phosphatase-like protein [Cokeromyces recurvatus]